MVKFARLTKESPPWSKGKKFWVVIHPDGKSKDLVNTFSEAVRYWLWAVGVSPKIAFYRHRKITKYDD